MVTSVTWTTVQRVPKSKIKAEGIFVELVTTEEADSLMPNQSLGLQEMLQSESIMII